MLRRLALALVFAAFTRAALSQSLPNNVNFSSTTPAAPSGYRDIAWQTVTASGLVNISGNIPNTANVPVCSQTSGSGNVYTCTTAPPVIVALFPTIVFIPTTNNSG